MSKLSRDDNGQLCNFGRLGASQVIAVASNATSECLPINTVEYIEVTPGHKIAVVCGTTTTFSVTEIV
jgi:hypothetical protein